MTIDYSLDEYIKSSLIYSHWYYLSKSNWTFIHDHHSLFMLLADNFILFILTTVLDALSWWHFLYCCCCCMDGCWCCIFGLEFASMVRALPLRWCKSTLPRFSESIVFETCVPMTFDGIYNSKYSVLVDTLLSASDILRIFPSSHLSCAEYREEEPYFFCNDCYLKMFSFYSILYYNALWYFPQVLNNYRPKTRLMIYNTLISQLHFLYLVATQFRNILL